MLLPELNAMTAAEADAAVRPCVDIDAWVDAVVGGRPYDTVADLLAVADAQARTWSPAEVEGALADHPRIGERHQGSGASAAMSGSEQSPQSLQWNIAALLACSRTRKLRGPCMGFFECEYSHFPIRFSVVPGVKTASWTALLKR